MVARLRHLRRHRSPPWNGASTSGCSAASTQSRASPGRWSGADRRFQRAARARDPRRHERGAAPSVHPSAGTLRRGRRRVRQRNNRLRYGGAGTKAASRLAIADDRRAVRCRCGSAGRLHRPGTAGRRPAAADAHVCQHEPAHDLPALAARGHDDDGNRALLRPVLPGRAVLLPHPRRAGHGADDAGHDGRGHRFGTSRRPSRPLPHVPVARRPDVDDRLPAGAHAHRRAPVRFDGDSDPVHRHRDGSDHARPFDCVAERQRPTRPRHRDGCGQLLPHDRLVDRSRRERGAVHERARTPTRHPPPGRGRSWRVGEDRASAQADPRLPTPIRVAVQQSITASVAQVFLFAVAMCVVSCRSVSPSSSGKSP